MKLNRTLSGFLSLLLFFTVACQKEISIELGKLPVIQPTPIDSSHTPPKALLARWLSYR